MSNNPELYKKLMEYNTTDYYPFHMPGHKRQFPGLYGMDITEIEGFDNLHHPEGIIKESMEWVASLYGADRSYYLINGSSGGILSAISGIVPDYGTILMSRNCHKAAYHGVILKHLKTVYIYPQFMEEYGIQCGLSPEKIEELLKKNREVKGVFVVSPTYDGIVSDIAAISHVCHKYNIPLIVDEAHGAHFRYSHEFPKSALELGADVVIQSVHKTLPCFTQSALLHIKGNYVDREKIEWYLQVYQSSSPSYLLMSGIERGIWWMEQEEGKRKMKEFLSCLSLLRRELKDMRNLKILDRQEIGKKDIYDIDVSKIIISVGNTGISGIDLSERLRKKYHLEMEMCTIDYVTAIASVMDTKEGLIRLKEALLSIDSSFDLRKDRDRKRGLYEDPKRWEARPIAAMYEAWGGRKEQIPLRNSVGKTAAEFVYLYPPGIPIVAPGELITEYIVQTIMEYKKAGLPVQGMQDTANGFIYVLREGE